MGDALFAAQVGEKHDHAKPLKGFGGAAVLEIVERYDTDAYRAVYTVALSEAVYVLHAFQKKIEGGTRDATTRCCYHPATLAGGPRNGRAVAPPARGTGATGARESGGLMSDGYNMTVNETDVYVGSGNVYEDLGLDDADELFAKAALAHRINTIIKERGWTQAQAAAILGVSQPNISLLARGRLSNFSFDRLFRFLAELGQEVDITIAPRERDHKPIMVRTR